MENDIIKNKQLACKNLIDEISKLEVEDELKNLAMEYIENYASYEGIEQILLAGEDSWDHFTTFHKWFLRYLDSKVELVHEYGNVTSEEKILSDPLGIVSEIGNMKSKEYSLDGKKDYKLE